MSGVISPPLTTKRCGSAAAEVRRVSQESRVSSLAVALLSCATREGDNRCHLVNLIAWTVLVGSACMSNYVGYRR